MSAKSKTPVRKPSSAPSGGASYTSFGGQIGGVISLADSLIARADEVYKSSNCFTAEVYSRTVADYASGIELYQKALMPDIPSEKREVIEKKKINALANGYGLLNKMVEKCGIQDQSIQDLLKRDQTAQKKEQSYVSQLRRKATDADENRRQWRQQILDLFQYDPCSYPDFTDLAGGQDYEKRFQLEANTLIYKNFQSGGRLVNMIFVYGPPGTGKTQIAQSVAGFLAKQNQPPVFVSITASSIRGAFVGESEAKLKFFFEEIRNEAARGSPVVAFFDEFDGLAGEGANGQRDTTLISEFKTQADNPSVSAEINSRILIIVATNNPYLIPDDVFSRISTKYFIGLPGLKETRFVVNRQLKSLGWESLNLVDLRNVFRDKDGNLLPDIKADELLSIRAQRWDEERKEELPPTWTDAILGNVDASYAKLSSNAVNGRLLSSSGDVAPVAKFLAMSLVLPVDPKTIEALNAATDVQDFWPLYLNDNTAAQFGFVDRATLGNTFTRSNITANVLGAQNRAPSIDNLGKLINFVSRKLTDFAINFFELNWDDRSVFEDKFKLSFGNASVDTMDLMRDVLIYLGSSMDAVDIMSLRFRSKFFSIREIGIVFTNMMKIALDRSAGFRSFETDTSKMHYSKWLLTRKIASNKTYTKDGCKEEKYAITKLIPLNRSTFKDFDDGAKKPAKLASNVRDLSDKTLEDFDKLEKKYLDATDQYTPKDKLAPRDQVTLRYGLDFGFKFDSTKQMTRVSCKVSTDPDTPNQKFSKIIVTQRYTNSRKTVKTDLITGKSSADILTKTVREFKLPLDKKKWDPETNKAFAEVKTKIQLLNKTIGDTSKIISDIIGIMDTAFPTKPIIQNTDGMLVDTSNLIDLLAPCQVTYSDFNESYGDIEPKLTYNAQQIIDWAGGVNKIVTLQKPYFANTIPSSIQDLIIAASSSDSS